MNHMSLDFSQECSNQTVAGLKLIIYRVYHSEKLSSNQTVAGLKHNKTTSAPRYWRFKSDRCGIETLSGARGLSMCSYCSNQTVAGLKPAITDPSAAGRIRSNQTVAGLKPAKLTS